MRVSRLLPTVKSEDLNVTKRRMVSADTGSLNLYFHQRLTAFWSADQEDL